MEFNFSVRTDALFVSWLIARKGLEKLTTRMAYCLFVFLSIWIETIADVDTLKIRKKGGET